MNLILFLSDHATAIGAIVAAGISGLGAWVLSLHNISAAVERSRIVMTAVESKAESVERAAFRSSLIAEVAEMRQLIKECETDKVSLRQRLTATEGQILVLKASNDIMERWIAFFNERGLPLDHVTQTGPSADDVA